MPDTHSLRLYVDINITETPLRVEIEFPNKQLAERYRQSIRKTKVLPSGDQEDAVVVMELPPSAGMLETSRSLEAFIVHFDKKRNADDWADDICLHVKDRERQIFIKQYWNEDEAASLKKSLPRLPPSKAPPPSKSPPPSKPPPADRAGALPGHAQASGSGHARRPEKPGTVTGIIGGFQGLLRGLG